MGQNYPADLGAKLIGGQQPWPKKEIPMKKIVLLTVLTIAALATATSAPKVIPPTCPPLCFGGR
jgi:hypothetical protein